MKNRLLILFLFLSAFGICQDVSKLINEFHLSGNHGLSAPKTFFGGGLGASHVFRADQPLGARIGLEADFYHFWNAGVSGPEFNKYESRSNQHFNAVNL